ncbi:hypothetical protein Scep_012893 [Stephania cephalantha]|uniref:Uncharacterized protein n=1 Tax=Stephania cephalantha TaxID=152367 RepID=A0AAP0JI09_9MAGN
MHLLYFLFFYIPLSLLLFPIYLSCIYFISCSFIFPHDLSTIDLILEVLLKLLWIYSLKLSPFAVTITCPSFGKGKEPVIGDYL